MSTSHWIHFFLCFFFNSLFDYSSSTWKTGCVSVRSVSPGTQRSDQLWFHMVPDSETGPLNFCFLHLHNMCFHLGQPCQYVSGTQALFLQEQWQGQSVKTLNVCVSLFSSGFCDLWGEIPVLVGVILAQRKAQEMLRGLSFLPFSPTLMTLMKEWKGGFGGWAKRH